MLSVCLGAVVVTGRRGHPGGVGCDLVTLLDAVIIRTGGLGAGYRSAGGSAMSCGQGCTGSRAANGERRYRSRRDLR